MSKYELSITPNYVKNWGVKEALREVFQNAIDEEKVNPEHKMLYEYSSEDITLSIKNIGAFLEKKSLLLGTTSKDNTKTIGQFGEGYKIATIVFLRCGFEMKILNHDEIWTPKIVKSRRYGTEIVVFEIKKSKCNTGNLEFIISGLSKGDWDNFKTKYFLEPSKYPKCERTKSGNILLDKQYKGNIYVNGLFVCKNDDLHYGYDFEPSIIKLDRDRGLVDYFDMRVACGIILSSCDNLSLIKESMEYIDSDYIAPSWESTLRGGAIKKYADMLAEEIIRETSDDCVISTNIDEYTRLVGLGKNVKYIPEKKYNILERSKLWGERSKYVFDNSSIKEQLTSWFEECKEHLPDDLTKKGQTIVDLITGKYLR